MDIHEWEEKLEEIFNFGCAGFVLLKFREGVVRDPFGALLTWNEDYEEVNPSYGLEWSAQVEMLLLYELYFPIISSYFLFEW